MPTIFSTSTPNRNSEILGSIDSASNGAVEAAYTYIPWATMGRRFALIQLALTATTVTIEATADDPTIADASANWTDITLALFGVASFTSASDLIIDTPLLASRIRIKHLPTNATNSYNARLSCGN